jgi:hypothetical protein
VKEGQGIKTYPTSFSLSRGWKYSIAQRTFLRGIVSTLPIEQNITVISQVHIAASQPIPPPKLETTMQLAEKYGARDYGGKLKEDYGVNSRSA